jgi:hypothetical protein
MTYEDFVKFVQFKCMHEAIYEDTEGRSILVIKLLDAYGMVNKLSQPTGFVDSKINPTQRTWVGLTDEEMLTLEETTTCTKDESWLRNLTQAIEAKLKEKNNG